MIWTILKKNRVQSAICTKQEKDDGTECLETTAKDPLVTRNIRLETNIFGDKLDLEEIAMTAMIIPK